MKRRAKTPKQKPQTGCVRGCAWHGTSNAADVAVLQLLELDLRLDIAQACSAPTLAPVETSSAVVPQVTT